MEAHEQIKKQPGIHTGRVGNSALFLRPVQKVGGEISNYLSYLKSEGRMI